MSESQQKSENVHVNSRMLVILMLLVGLVNIVGIIISACAMMQSVKPNVSISQSSPYLSAKYLQDLLKGGLGGGTGGNHPGTSGTSGTTGKRSVNSMPSVDENGNRIWTVAIGHELGANDYVDRDGYIQGFNKMMIVQVCNAADIHCDVIYDAYQNCWTSDPGQHPRGGEGLLGGWYDACIGWTKTVERSHVFEFSLAYQQASGSYFFVHKNMPNINLLDFRNKTIGFMAGSASSEKCLARLADKALGNPIDPQKIIYASDPYSLVQLLKLKKVDAILSNLDAMNSYIQQGEVRLVSNDAYLCSMDGYAAMTRKDSQFIDLWNKGYQKIKENGEYKSLCDSAKKEHGAYGNIVCL